MADIFDPLLHLEEDFYDEGYAQGTADGAEAGLIEGRIFGLEKGFDKFLEVGKLQGKCSVWNARIPAENSSPPPKLAIPNPRTQRNIQALSLILTHLPYKNDDEAVEEVDETLKKARVKAKMVERMLGEKGGESNGRGDDGEQNIEDAGRSAAAATALMDI